MIFSSGSQKPRACDLICQLLQMGNFVQYACTFISGFAVAFSATWKLSLVTLGVLPPIALIGVAYAASLTGITSKISKRMQRRGE